MLLEKPTVEPFNLGHLHGVNLRHSWSFRQPTTSATAAVRPDDMQRVDIASVNGATVQTSPLGYAAAFDGNDDVFSRQLGGNIPRPYTVVLYCLSRTTPSAASQVLFSHDNNAANGAGIARSTANKLRLTFWGVADYDFSNLTWPGNGVPTFAAVTVPANSGTAVAYVGRLGSPLTRDTAAVGTMGGTPNRLTVGGLNWLAVSLDGFISRALVYNGDVSEALIRQLNDPLLMWAAHRTEPTVWACAAAATAGGPFPFYFDELAGGLASLGMGSL